MKKIIAMLLAVMMVLAMVACAAKQAETTTELPAAADANGKNGEPGVRIGEQWAFGGRQLLRSGAADEQPAQAENHCSSGKRDGKNTPEFGGTGVGMFHETPPRGLRRKGTAQKVCQTVKSMGFCGGSHAKSAGLPVKMQTKA